MDQQLEGSAPPGLTDAQLLAAAGFEAVTLLTDEPQAAIYRVTQPALRRTVAVRLQHEPMTDAAARARFAEQCAVLGSIGGHPNIVEVYGCEFGGGRPYVVMELPAGGTLAERLLQTRGLPWSEAIEMLVVLAGALETAHRAGVVHGRISADNVRVSAYGPPQLAGFARFADEPAPTSATQDVRDLAAVCRVALADPSAAPAAVQDLLRDAAAGHVATAVALGLAAQQLQRDLGVEVTPLPLRPATAAPVVDRRRRVVAVALAAGGVALIGALLATLVLTPPTAGGTAAAVLEMARAQGAVSGSWRPDPALATQLRTAPDAYLCRDPAAAAQAQSIDVAAAQLPTAGARVGVVLRRLPVAAGRELLDEVPGQADCLERLGGLTQVAVTATETGEQGVLLRYRRPAAASPVEIVVLLARHRDTVAEVVHLGYPATDPAVTTALQGALAAALTGGTAP